MAIVFGASPSRRRSTVIHFAAQCASFGFIIVQGIVLVPAYLHYVGVALYGAWLASSQAFSWISLVDPGTDEVVRQRCAHAYGRKERSRIGEFIGAGMAVNATTALLVFGLAALFAQIVPRWFGQHGNAAQELRRALLVLAFGSALTIGAYAVGSPLLALQRAAVHGPIYIAGTVVGIATTVVLLRSGGGVCAIPAGLLARSATWMVGWGSALYWLCRRVESIPLRFRLSQAKELMCLSGFTFLAKLAYALQTSADGIVIGSSLGPTETARYVLTGRFIDGVRAFPDRIGTAVQPSLAHLFGEGEPGKIRGISLRFIRVISLTAAFLIAVAVAFNQDIVRLWVGQRLYGGTALTLLLGTAACFSAIANSGYHVVFASGAIRTAAGTMCLQGLLKIAVGYALLRPLGLLALPVGGLAALMVTGLPRFWRSCVVLLGVNDSERRRVAMSVARPVAICSLAGLMGALWPHPGGNLQAAAFATLFAGSLAAALCALDPTARSEMTGLVGRIRGVQPIAA